MKVRSPQRVEYVFPQPIRSPRKVMTALQPSPNDSVKKSNTSTHLSERSNSTKKIFIPRSHKLDQFFNQTPHISSQKRLASPSDHFRGLETNRNKPERIEFLRFNLNKDYFNDDQEAGLGRQFDRSPDHNIYIERSSHKYDEKKNVYTTRNLNREKSMPKIVSLKSEGDLTSRRMKSPKVFVPSVEKVMTRSKKVQGKISSKHELEYTFGIQ